MKTLREKLPLPLLAAGAGNVIWGFSYLFTRIGQQSASPEVLLAIRFVVAFFLMNLLVLFGFQKISFAGKPWKSVLVLAAAELACFYFESYGIYYTNASFAGTLMAVVPVVSIGFSIVFLREYPSKRQAFFCLFPVAGVAILAINGNEEGYVQPIGVLLLICFCFAAATYRTFNRKAAGNFTPFERAYIVIGACTVSFVLSSLRETKGDIACYLEPLKEPQFVMVILVMSVFCSVAANLLVNYAAGKISIVEMSVIGTISTICSMFGGIVFLHEPMNLAAFFGAMMILIGIHQMTKPEASAILETENIAEEDER